MVLRSAAWSLPWEKSILILLLTPCGVDFANTLLYHLKALQLSFFPFFLPSFPTLSEGYNTKLFGHHSSENLGQKTKNLPSDLNIPLSCSPRWERSGEGR